MEISGLTIPVKMHGLAVRRPRQDLMQAGMIGLAAGLLKTAQMLGGPLRQMTGLETKQGKLCHHFPINVPDSLLGISVTWEMIGLICKDWF